MVIDDGSTDGTLAKLRAFNDPRLKIITQTNTGFTPAIKRAIAESDGEYIAIHGSGDISYPDRILKQAAALQKKPNVGIVGCYTQSDTLFGDEPVISKAPNLPSFFDAMMDGCIFNHGSVMYRRDLYNKVGGYRDFFVFAQDMDLWLRMSLHCDYLILEEVLYRCFLMPDGASRNAQKSVLQLRLGIFAQQCVLMRKEQGKDMLDTIGPAAALMLKPTKLVSRRMLWLGVREMLNGQYESGRDLISQSMREYFSPQLVFVYVLSATYRAPVIWQKVTAPVFRRLLKKYFG